MRRSLLTLLCIYLLSTGAFAQTSSPPAGANGLEALFNPTFIPGDFFVSLSNGTVQWRHADGSGLRILDTANGGQAKGMAFDASGNLYVTHWYSPDLITGNNTEIFNSHGRFLSRFGSGYGCNPTSIVFDASGNSYVGQDCEADILKFDGSGNLIGRFNVVPELRGSSWIDLASDDCTVFYTSAGTHIKRFDICTNQQLADFNSTPLPDVPYAFRILPGGSVLVAATSAILLLSTEGNVTATFDAIGENCWYSLNLETSSTFLAGSFCSGSLYRFNLTTGAVLDRFDVAPEGTHIKGIVVAPPQGPPPPPGPPLPPKQGRWDVFKHVINDDGGTAVATQFSFIVVVDNDTAHPIGPIFFEPNGPASEGKKLIPVDAGHRYKVIEVSVPGYTSTILNAPDQECNLVIHSGQIAACNITNNDVPPQSPPALSCRMTGGGSVFTGTGIRVTHGFQLRAPATEQPQSLEVNWNDPATKGPDEMSFHLTQLTSATCVDDPNIDAGNPSTPYDTFIATGIGILKGVPGATIQLVFTDAGEPGGIKPKNPTPDTATMTIRDANGNVALVVSGPLDQGNHQMH